MDMTGSSLTVYVYFTLIHIEALLQKYVILGAFLGEEEAWRGNGKEVEGCTVALERESTLSGLRFLEVFLTRQFLIFKAQGFKKNKGKGCC